MSVRASGRRADELRPLRITRHYTRHAEGSVLIECGDTRVLCTASVEEGRAGVPQRPGPGLAHGRVRHAAAGDQHSRAPRGGRRQAIGPDAGNPAADRPQPARRRRPRAIGRAHDPRRLRRACRPMAARAARRSPALAWRCRRGRVVQGAGTVRRRTAQRFRRRGLGGHRRRRAGARSGLCRGSGLRHRHERRHDRPRRLRRNAGHRGRRAVHASRDGCAGGARRRRASASWSLRRSAALEA